MPPPETERTLTRAWNWGIVVIGDPTQSALMVELDTIANVAETGIVIVVRHAQDMEISDDGDFATATLRVRTLLAAQPAERSIACDVVLSTPSGQLSIGDADGEILVNGHGDRTRVVVSANNLEDTSPDELWIDLLPAES